MHFFASTVFAIFATKAMAQSFASLPVIPPAALTSCQNLNALTSLATMLQSCNLNTVTDPSQVTLSQVQCACKPANFQVFVQFNADCGSSLPAGFGEQIATVCKQVSAGAIGTAMVAATAPPMGTAIQSGSPALGVGIAVVVGVLSIFV
ncbi:hypothetical protein BC830DRAFT_1128208 [Chytriomyces sp. MP71]|nr:hypothetical protein BC830DRAFT_1128208 [Chytriomyces sp. MP71]